MFPSHFYYMSLSNVQCQIAGLSQNILLISLVMLSYKKVESERENENHTFTVTKPVTVTTVTVRAKIGLS